MFLLVVPTLQKLIFRDFSSSKKKFNLAIFQEQVCFPAQTSKNQLTSAYKIKYFLSLSQLWNPRT